MYSHPVGSQDFLITNISERKQSMAYIFYIEIVTSKW